MMETWVPSGLPAAPTPYVPDICTVGTITFAVPGLPLAIRPTLALIIWLAAIFVTVSTPLLLMSMALILAGRLTVSKVIALPLPLPRSRPSMAMVALVSAMVATLEVCGVPAL